MEEMINSDMDEWEDIEFKFILNACIFKRFLEAVSISSDSFAIQINNGISTEGYPDKMIVDPSNVYGVGCEIGGYEIGKDVDSPVKIAIEVKSILRFLKLIQKESRLKIEKNKNTKAIKLTSSEGYILKYYPVSFHDVSKSSKFDFRDFTFSHKLTYEETSRLKRFFQKINGYDGSIDRTIIQCNGKELIFRLEDDYSGSEYSYCIQLSKPQEKFKAMFTKYYFDLLFRKVRSGDRFEIKVKENYPILINWNIWDSIDAFFTLAPRIEDSLAPRIEDW